LEGYLKFSELSENWYSGVFKDGESNGDVVFSEKFLLKIFYKPKGSALLGVKKI
jgi:hypothetical protein